VLHAHGAADPAAADFFHRHHPHFLDDKIKWLPKFIADSEIRDAFLSPDDARLAIARYYTIDSVKVVISEGFICRFRLLYVCGVH
jgi:hypothetical protein